MATTTNFGWATPDDTDFVKDGAAAIRTLGSSIDTSLVDLKGGTTGQILAKTSATDMDFTWVAQQTLASYTPTWTNVTVGNATQSFNYIKIGKFVFVRGYFIFGSTTSISGTPNLSLPFTSVNYTHPTVVGNSSYLDSGTARFFGSMSTSTTSNDIVICQVYRDYVVGGITLTSQSAIDATTPITWTTNDGIFVQFTYEAA